MKKTHSRVIPSYALYGDQAQPGWKNAFDFEWIPQRSGPNNWEISPHLHESFIQILYLTHGAGEVLLDNAKWRVNAPCLLIVPAQTVHGFHFSGDVNGPVVTATQRPLESLAALVMPELLQTIRKPAVMALGAEGQHDDALMPLFLALEREARAPAVGQFAAGMSLLTALLVQVARLGQTTAPAPLALSLRKTAQIEKFRALVNAHFKKHLPMAFYASQLGVTPGQLSRLCREVLGTSSLALINARLIHEAQRDLVFTSSSIQQLADALGFADEAYFGRFFRKHTGLTPREFRAKALQSMLRPDGWPGTGADGAAAP
ncbi:MAG: helix-turn-helix domain-containing protein [Polaromonas sp.]|nr:helix-turn-helix domain-containing protein [Polaromonas sp.]